MATNPVTPSQFCDAIPALPNPEPNGWIPFGDRFPSIGMEIDVMAEDVPRLNLGKLTHIDRSCGWVTLSTERALGAAVREHYTWRESGSRK